MLEITVADLKNKGKFVGVVLRPRSSQLPIGFGDKALAAFSADTKQQKPATRQDLKSDKKLYAEYKEWWFGKRFEFLNKIRDYLRAESGNKDAVVLYEADPSEPGPR